jgi:hypothetical protein
MNKNHHRPLGTSLALTIALQFGVLAYFERTFAAFNDLVITQGASQDEIPALSKEEFRAHYESHRSSVLWLGVLIKFYYPEKYGSVRLDLLIEKLKEHDITKVDDSPELISKLGIDISRGTLFERFYKIHQIAPKSRTDEDLRELETVIAEHNNYEAAHSDAFFKSRNMDPNGTEAVLMKEIIHTADATARGFDGTREYRLPAKLASQSVKFLPKPEHRRMAAFLEQIYPLVILEMKLENFIGNRVHGSTPHEPKEFNAENLNILLKAIVLRTGREGCEILNRLPT